MKRPFEFKELLSYTTPYRRTLLLITILMLCESGVALLSPWMAGRFTEARGHAGTPPRPKGQEKTGRAKNQSLPDNGRSRNRC